MYIDATAIVGHDDAYGPLVGSIAELGNGAEEAPVLKTDEERAAARDYFKSMGAWSEKEIAKWSNAELDAIVIQDVRHHLRQIDDWMERHLDNWDYDDMTDVEWSDCFENSGGSLTYDSTGKTWQFHLGF